MKSIYTILISIALLASSNLYAFQAQWSSNFSIDITRNGINETVTYNLKETAQNYEASLVIITEEKNILWHHEYSMTKDDLVGDLLANEGGISIAHWVKHFFDGSLIYGAKFEKYKIKREEINMAFLEFYSTQLKPTKNELKDLILSNKINTLFSYRASWREDLVMLVYVPKLKKLVHYSDGEY